MNTIIALIATFLLGYTAQRFGICMVRATRNTLKGNPNLLVAILLSGAWVWLYSITAYFNDWTLPFERYALHPVFIFGGLLFGVGASINQGCSISTMNKLAKGHVGMLLTIMGWFIGWSIWAQIRVQSGFNIEYKKEATLGLMYTLGVSVSVLIVTAIFVIRFKPPIKLMLGVLCIGLLASLLFYLEPNWPPSHLMNDMGNAVLHGQEMPSYLRMGIVVGMLIGMWVAVFVNHNARLRFPRWRSAVRFLVAGSMMGVGAGMALGGNDTQLLFGIPATSPGALSAILFMFIGIVCEQLLYQRGAVFYRKSLS